MSMDLTGTIDISRFFKSNYTDNLAKEYVQTLQSYFIRLITISKLVTKYQISSVLKPFEFISDTETVYRLYVQPVMFVVAITTLIMIAVFTKKDKCFKTHLLTITFLLNDTLGILLPLPFHFAFLPSDPDNAGLNYKWCEPFRVLVAFLPQALFYHSQWLKFAACIFECVSIYFPKRANWLFRKRFLATLLIVSLLVSTAVSSLMHYDVEFQKFFYTNPKTRMFVETCIMIPSAIYNVGSLTYNMIRIITPMTVGVIVPLVCLVFASIILYLEIRSQSKVCITDKKRKLSPERYQHVTFVAITSTIYIIILLPRLASEIFIINEISMQTWDHLLAGRIFELSQVVFHMTTPITFGVYVVTKKLSKNNLDDEINPAKQSANPMPRI